MPRTPTEIDKGVAKSTKQTTVADKARAAPEDEGDVIAKWRRARGRVFCGARQFRLALWPITQDNRRALQWY